MLYATTLLTALASLVAAAPHTAPRDGSSTGSLTWYTEGLGVTPTACGSIVGITEHIAALSPEDYGTYDNPNDSPVCGKTITIHGSNGNTVQAKVADRCAGCSTGDVDVTPTVFELLGLSQSIGRVQISWELS
ncbi:hypothetical protein VPNG_06840 [Cytospora leucostoma]|uniref:RlpA-like protein double-psi beta-barrel domain-containing protein n=1 Tax=Cytospora leucostoma TaxID=1230097 RepID=A0A423WVS2_9PEZI|nr:hypothetical protein VPNG_06840 [Cytospora leucostoma]